MKFKILLRLGMNHFVLRFFLTDSTEYEATKKPEHFPAEIILPYHGPLSPPQLNAEPRATGFKPVVVYSR
jgi:hypothetical protein